MPTRLGRLRAHVRGDADEAIVMWPALLMDHRMFDAQAGHFADRYTTIALDPPGHADSEPLRRTFTFEDCAGCLADVLDHFGLPRAHVFGNSWGAMAGGAFAALHPERAGHCVLLNGTALPSSFTERAKNRTLLTLGRAMGGVRPPLTGAVVQAMLGKTSVRTRPPVKAEVLEVSASHAVDSLTHAIRSVVIQRPDLRGLLQRVRTPVLVIAGREDGTFPLKHSEAMAAAIPGAELKLLDGVAHLAALEDPTTVNRLADAFLVRTAG